MALAIAAIATLVGRGLTRSTPSRLTRVALATPANARLDVSGRFNDIAISPDGSSVVYVVGQSSEPDNSICVQLMGST